MENNSLIRSFMVDALPVRVFASQSAMSDDAALTVHEYLAATLARQKKARVILATGNSQLRFLALLVQMDGVDWSRVTLFHMDEYIGLPADHPACFRRYMRERVESVLKPRKFHYIEGDAPEPLKECERYAALLREQPIDLCCLGVGENGHLAFNDPPVADFNDPLAVKIVEMDHACRMQQVGEGHFPNIEAMPQHAITLTIPMLCSAKKLVCLCPETRKAAVVKTLLQGPIATSCPASILRKQPHALLLLDTDSASLL
ncbi:MAG: glucosamine-6-phosphate deaminase [Pedosphaera sp.]|nr:glucosamine-6-phosphate deaminase [Pedosphaera sp.]